MGLKMGIGIGLNIFVVLLMACFKKFSKNFFQKKMLSLIIIVIIIIFKRI